MWHTVKKMISAHDQFILTTHINPDGDGVGSMCALTELLLSLGKKVKIVTDDPIPSKYRFLDFHRLSEVYDPAKDYSSFQVLIVVDTHRKDRIGGLSKLIQNPSLKVVCIDHHEPSDVLTSLAVIDTTACSAGAMIYALFKDCGLELNLRAATGIYASVICDTGRFCYSSTNRKAHRIADECMEIGVDPDEMYSRLYQHVSLAEIKMVANVLQHMETHLDNRVVVQQIFQEDCHNAQTGIDLDIEHTDLEYFHDFNKMIEDVECIVLLRELPGGFVRVSLRSKSTLDINPIVKALGGGGHSRAAGVTCSGSLSDVKTKILSMLQEAFKKSECISK